MNERKTDAILYIVLFVAILVFLYINVFSTCNDFGYMNMNGIEDGTQNGVKDSASKCSCGGAERIIDGLLDSVDADAVYIEADENTDAVYVEADENTDAVYVEADENTDAVPQKEDASSVKFDEDTKQKEHNISPTGYHIFVDLDDLLMFVYKDGEPVKTYECSGGKPNSPSPIGTWKIISKDTWGEGFGGAWLGFNVPWGKYGIHGTSEPWSIGKTNASKGCIRMRNSDVWELFRLVPHNTLVTIVYDNIPFYPMRDGDVGSDVQSMERALKKLGYYHGSEDGVFGGSLKSAVMKFQEQNKLYSTGVINNSTYERILQMEKEYDEKQKKLKQEQEEEWKRLEQELE